MSHAGKRYRFDMRGAHEAGELRHPQIVILAWFPDASDLEPVSIADCWLFASESVRPDAPDYFVRLPDDRRDASGSVPVLSFSSIDLAGVKQGARISEIGYTQSDDE
ncbi:MAG: hypothetical protein EPN98_21430 [Phenylobacterium sp.]|uniref:hypothetical protein n=1 Tax=Phenylobacterium sp. TaxID=1871053 RepID=UPI0012169C2C|nr:hypothetical protein [Phenylobacterium sp.]TAL29007.1 MAG: hypothetical protein EPN98_21430 [Phenylobacterium sp.]